MGTMREFTYPSSDGVHQVHGVRWLPDATPRGVIQIAHGIAEYVGRYDDFARFLTSNGFVVTGNDHLGHGGTAGGPEEYGFLAPSDGWTHLADDVRALRLRTGADYPDLPCFLLGHSMGSFVARTYLIRWPGDVDGCILSGTGQEAPVTVACGKLLAGLFCRLRGSKSVSKTITNLSLGAYNRQFRPNRTGADWLSRDMNQVDAYAANPLCQFVPTVGMFHDMMGGLQFISNPTNLGKMDPDTPIYLFSGDRDPVGASGVGVKKVLGFFRRAGAKDVSIKLYPGGRHEMLNETNRAAVYRDTLDWLEAHLPQQS